MESWVPVHGEPIVVYSYPSYSVFSKGATDTAVWNKVLKSDKQSLHYMTPRLTGLLKFNVCVRYMPQYGTFSYVTKVPVDSIHQILVDPEQPGGWDGPAALGIGLITFTVVAATILIAWLSQAEPLSGWF
jgi:hypothetical protein